MRSSAQESRSPEERVSLPLKLRKGEDTGEFAHLVAESFLLTASVLSLMKPRSIHVTEERPQRKLAKDYTGSYSSFTSS